MAVVTHGSTLPDSAQKTDFYGIVDNATVTSIVAADLSASAGINDTQLNTISTAGKVNTSALTGQIANANLAQLITPALVSGASLTLLPNIPSGAGLVPKANIGRNLGTWDASKTIGQIYQATTDTWVVGWMAGSSGNPLLNVVTDSSATPTVVRDFIPGSITSTSSPGFVKTLVKYNDYFEVSINLNGGTVSSSGMYVLPISS